MKQFLWMLKRIARDIVTGRARVHVSPFWLWRALFRRREFFGVFRNRPGIIGFRWGFRVLGFEIGNRNGVWPEDRVNVWPPENWGYA